MDLAKKIKKIEALKLKLSGSGSNQSWDQAFIEEVKTSFTYYSNKIEGNAITFGQTIQLLKDFVTPKNASTGECLDILNHQRVLDEVFEEYQATTISESSMLRIHRELMKNPDQWADSIHYDPGKYKIHENLTIRMNGKIHRYAEPGDVKKLLVDLIKSTNQRILDLDAGNSADHILNIATDFHYHFLNDIHPFGDGNGRLARIYMNLILLKAGYPPIFIKPVDKNDYMNRFEEEESNPGAMLDFMADQLLKSLKEKQKFFEQAKRTE